MTLETTSGLLLATAGLLLVMLILLPILFRLFKSLLSRLLLFILNGSGGLILLLLLKYVFEVNLPLNIYTAAVVVIFGLPGLLCLLILHYGGII